MKGNEIDSLAEQTPSLICLLASFYDLLLSSWIRASSTLISFYNHLLRKSPFFPLLDWSAATFHPSAHYSLHTGRRLATSERHPTLSHSNDKKGICQGKVQLTSRQSNARLAALFILPGSLARCCPVKPKVHSTAAKLPHLHEGGLLATIFVSSGMVSVNWCIGLLGPVQNWSLFSIPLPC